MPDESQSCDGERLRHTSLVIQRSVDRGTFLCQRARCAQVSQPIEDQAHSQEGTCPGGRGSFRACLQDLCEPVAAFMEVSAHPPKPTQRSRKPERWLIHILCCSIPF